MIHQTSLFPHQLREAEKPTDFQTPHAVCRYMVNLVPKNAGRVLEPTPGVGNIVHALEKKGFLVVAPNDFFLLEKQPFDAIVMNPPFSSKYARLENAPPGLQNNDIGMLIGYHMLTECMKMSDHVIALMPWFTLSDSDIRLRTFRDFGMKSLTALPRKTFRYARVQTVVIELHKGWKKPTQFHVFDF